MLTKGTSFVSIKVDTSLRTPSIPPCILSSLGLTCAGVEILEQLEMHPNIRISTAAANVMRTYFSEREVLLEDLMPTEVGGHMHLIAYSPLCYNMCIDMLIC